MELRSDSSSQHGTDEVSGYCIMVFFGVTIEIGNVLKPMVGLPRSRVACYRIIADFVGILWL